MAVLRIGTPRAGGTSSSPVGRRLVSADRRGSVLYVGSRTSQRAALPNTVAYAAAKSGPLGLMRTLALEWAPHDIRVNTILAGFVATEMTRDIDNTPERLVITSRNPARAARDAGGNRQRRRLPHLRHGLLHHRRVRHGRQRVEHRLTLPTECAGDTHIRPPLGICADRRGTTESVAGIPQVHHRSGGPARLRANRPQARCAGSAFLVEVQPAPGGQDGCHTCQRILRPCAGLTHPAITG
jgi:enoyl-ACP reductase-like protein